MILATEGVADLGERLVRELPRKMHRDLTREGHGFRPVLGLQIGELDLPVEKYDRIELALNLRTAREIGLTIPPSVRFRADKGIE